MKRFLALAVVAVALIATGDAKVKSHFATRAVVPTPPSAYQQPDPATYAANVDFWSGYKAGQLVAIPVPNQSFTDWWSYIAAVRQLELPRRVLFFVNNYNVGVDSAMEDDAAWQWQNSPSSCYVVVCQ